jgi:4-carboxymuconolactone decarboxylase
MSWLGIAKVLDFIHATNDVLTERGVELPLPPQSTTTPENRMEKGLAVEKQIVGSDVVEKLYANSPKDQIHIQHFLSANCFGDHYTRAGIDIPTRELLTLSMLVSLGGCEISTVSTSPKEGRYHEDEKEGHENQET